MGLIIATASLRASSAAPVPTYRALRYEEDFSYLHDPSMRSDLLDPLKFIPLNPTESVFLSMGGEIRERYEYFSTTLWGQGPEDGYLLQRYMLHADLQMGGTLRFFSQLKSGIESGRTGGPRPTDEDRLDLNQAFFDLRCLENRTATFTVRAGRQEMAFGSSRLISFREGPNVRLSFDGLRGILRVESWQIDAFVANPVQTKPGTFDDSRDRRQKLWGIYAVTPFPSLPDGHLDLYYLGLVRDLARFDQGVAREERHSVGIRLWGRTAGWDYNFEVVGQLGTFGDGDIVAWTVASDTGYTFSDIAFTPRLSLKADVASGDRDPERAGLETFNALFPRGAYFGESSLIGPANFFDVHPGVDLHFTKSITCSADWGFFWRESLRDGLYGPAVNLVRSGKTSLARAIGSQAALRADWRIGRHWTFVVTGSRFFAGDFIRESGPGQDVNYFSSWVTCLF